MSFFFAGILHSEIVGLAQNGPNLFQGIKEGGTEERRQHKHNGCFSSIHLRPSLESPEESRFAALCKSFMFLELFQ